MLKAEHLKRYRDIAMLLVKHGRSEWVRQAGLTSALADEDDAAAAMAPQATARAEELATDLERMGPTFIKLGQLLSTRADLLPLPYLQALSRLQDDVEPFPFADVERIVTEELGVKLSRAFADFSEEPHAAASLAQVHRASLRDGRAVAVKVQRPGIRARVAEDLEVFSQIAEMLERHTDGGGRFRFGLVLEEFRQSLARELDYQREAAHLGLLGKNLAEFDRIVVPQPVLDYTTSRVLTMEYIPGTKIDRLSPVVRVDIPGAALADELLRAYLHQILVDGFFHADPHPGNVLLTADHRIALLDLGMVGHVAPGLQDRLLELLLAVAEGRGEEAAELTLRMSDVDADADRVAFRRFISTLVAEHRQATLADLQLGRVVLEVVGAASANGIHVPPELALLGKTLLNLDLVARLLDPDLDPNGQIRDNAAALLQRRMLSSLTPGNVLANFIQTKELVEQLPGRLNRVLDVLADNQLRLKVDAIDEVSLIRGLQKIGNRIAAGAIIAALIIGAALMMKVETAFTLLGYPGFAMLCFLGAGAVGVWMLWDIILHDRRHRGR